MCFTIGPTTNLFRCQTVPETPQRTHLDYYNTRDICKTYFLVYCSISSTRNRLYQLLHMTKTIVTLLSTQI